MQEMCLKEAQHDWSGRERKQHRTLRQGRAGHEKDPGIFFAGGKGSLSE